MIICKLFFDFKDWICEMIDATVSSRTRLRTFRLSFLDNNLYMMCCKVFIFFVNEIVKLFVLLICFMLFLLCRDLMIEVKWCKWNFIRSRMMFTSLSWILFLCSFKFCSICLNFWWRRMCFGFLIRVYMVFCKVGRRDVKSEMFCCVKYKCFVVMDFSLDICIVFVFRMSWYMVVLYCFMRFIVWCVIFVERDGIWCVRCM